MKNKKPLFIAIIALDLALTIFFLVISIIMLAQTVGKTPAEIAANDGFIGYLQNHTTVYFLGFVLPLFVLLAGNIIGLVIFVVLDNFESLLMCIFDDLTNFCIDFKSDLS